MSDFYHQEVNPYLVASSLLFLLPILTVRRLHLAATAHTLLSVAVISTAYHATKNPILYWVDQAAVGNLVWRSVVDGWKGGGTALRISAAVNTGAFILYYVGRATGSLIWSKEFWFATASHATLHIGVVAGYLQLLQNYRH
jgi:hypothetical protein